MLSRSAPLAARAARGLAGAGARAKHTLVMMRHGQSAWNLENRFTGWVDVKLTPQGEAEAKRGGQELKAAGFEFDLAYTSYLQRAIKTCHLALEEMERLWIPVERDWRLNERHYGALSGLNKAETTAKHGEEKVTLWRRSFDVPPPALTESDPYYPGNDPRYRALTKAQLPKTESLKITCDRVIPFWNEVLAPTIRAGKNVLVVAHGNSLRALVKHLDHISDKDIVGVNIPTGIPLVYELDDDLRVIPTTPKRGVVVSPLRGYYLGSPEEILAEANKVAAQAKAKTK